METAENYMICTPQKMCQLHQIRKDQMSRSHNMYGGEDKYMQGFTGHI